MSLLGVKRTCFSSHPTKQPNTEGIRLSMTVNMAPTLGNFHRHIATFAIAFFSIAGAADAVELQLLSPNAMKTALNDLIPQFEQASGHRVTIFYATASKLVREIEDGKVADVAILSPEQIEQLEEDDKVVEDSRTPVAKLEIGVIIRRGATKPDLSTVHKLKQTLITAKSIASGDPRVSASGEYFAGLVERLRIADAIKPKMKSLPSSTAAVEAVAKGEADLGIVMVSVANTDETELAGIFPAQAKKSRSYAVGILTTSDHMQAAKDLASFVTSPSSLATLKTNGFDPP
jgi:molybdate transport system substrate-binding protein